VSVLVLAADFDLTADRLVLALLDRGAAVHRINTRWFPSRLSLAASLGQDGRWAGTLTHEHRSVELESVSAVYYRSPETFALPPDMSGPERLHALLEAKFGLGGVLAALPARWVDHPSAQADAAYKPVQLAVAVANGLPVPETVITNEPAPVRRFARAGRTITKTIASGTLHEDGGVTIARTRLLDEADLGDLRGIEQTCHLVQRWVPKVWEARVVVVGDTMTAVAIRAGSARAAVDWRDDYESLTYDVVALPHTVRAGIRGVMDHFGLQYGALDFAIGPDGGWVFLELNPTGVYDWLEHETGVPLTAQLADLLTTGSSA
jgi:ATP-grasp ribosomal peptide maturase